MVDFRMASKERPFEVLKKQTQYLKSIWRVIKADLVLKIFNHQLNGNQKWHSVVIIAEYEDYCTS